MRLIAALLHSKTAVAAVEFGVSLPLLLVLGLCGMETINFAMVHLKVSNIAMITADNAARVREIIDETDVNELFLGATLAGQSIEFDKHGRVILYDLEPSSDGTKQWIRWQRCSGSKNVAPTFGRPMTSSGANIVNGTEIYATNRTSVSSNPSAETFFTMTALGPDDRKIAAQPGTAVMVAEIIYDYQPLVANSVLNGVQVRYISAFNVRQRTNQSLRNSSKVTPKSCG